MFGVTKVSNAAFENYSVAGSARFENISCTNRLTCSGSLEIDSSKLNDVISSGTAHLTRSNAKTIRSSGSLEITDCGSIGSVKAAGSAEISGCQEIDEIIASGGFVLTASKVNRKAVLSGHEARISDSRIADLECANRSVNISNSSVGRIVVKPVFNTVSYLGWAISSANPPQTVELSGNNCRADSVVFNDGIRDGIVILKDGALVGTVQGGRVVRE